jgi:single-stranded DNA-specific DHH superfamily exonuclease
LENIPNAFAILHAKLPNSGYPFQELTGAGVALKLAQALFTRRMANSLYAPRKCLGLIKKS